MSNNKGFNPLSGCIVTIVGGFIITLLLMGAVDSCDSISRSTSKSMSEGLMQFFMWGSFWMVCYALFRKD